jgi:hypothetical protein
MAFDSLHAISSRIWEEVQGGWIFDDERVNLKLIRDKIHVARAKILGETLRQNLFINSAFYQTCCVDVECELPCEGAPIESTELVAKLPALIGSVNHRGVKYLGTVDRTTSFERRNSFEDFTQSLPFSGCPAPFYVITDNNKAIIRNSPTPDLKKLIVVALFTDPLACNVCSIDDPYPVPGGEVIKDIEGMVMMDLSNFLVRRKIDKQHNANPNN